MSWPALESDPEIFTNYFRSIGLSSLWEFTEVFTLDMQIPSAALILTYRKNGEGPVFDGQQQELPYFIRQIDQLDNSCGLLAALHSILNTEAAIDDDSLMKRLKQGITGKNPIESAHWLISNEELNSAHNNFASEGQSERTDEPTHHFVAFIPGLTLIDGMKESPLKLGNPGEDFSLDVFAQVQRVLEAGKIGQDMSLISFQRVDN